MSVEDGPFLDGCPPGPETDEVLCPLKKFFLFLHPLPPCLSFDLIFEAGEKGAFSPGREKGGRGKKRKG